MIEKVRLTVDSETERILDRVTSGLEERLSGEPEWARQLERRIEALETLLVKPAWVVSLRRDIAEDRRPLDEAASSTQKGVGLLSEIISDLQNSTRDLATDVAGLTRVVLLQQDLLQQQQAALLAVSRPWWKKLLG